MADRSRIEWTDASWNPIRARNKATGKLGWHCEHASPGCVNCYAEGFNADRLGTRLPFKPGHRADVEIFLDPDMLLQPLRWRRPRMIFVCSMTDLFADFVPDALIDQIFAVMAICPQHTFQVLTKRSARMRTYIEAKRRQAPEWVHLPEAHANVLLPYEGGWPTNVWLGVSAEDQRRAGERVPDLLATPAYVRFVSAEPLLGRLDLRRLAVVPNVSLDALTGQFTATAAFEGGLANVQAGLDALPPLPERRPGLDWVIVGGESGRKARAMHPDWAHGLCDQCAAAGVAFFFKQWGEWAPSTEIAAFGNPRSGWRSMRAHTDGLPRHDELYPEAGAAFVAHVGKKAAGRLLDGVEHNGMPAIAAEMLAGAA